MFECCIVCVCFKIYLFDLFPSVTDDLGALNLSDCAGDWVISGLVFCGLL